MLVQTRNSTKRAYGSRAEKYLNPQGMLRAIEAICTRRSAAIRSREGVRGKIARVLVKLDSGVSPDNGWIPYDSVIKFYGHKNFRKTARCLESLEEGGLIETLKNGGGHPRFVRLKSLYKLPVQFRQNRRAESYIFDPRKFARVLVKINTKLQERTDKPTRFHNWARRSINAVSAYPYSEGYIPVSCVVQFFGKERAGDLYQELKRLESVGFVSLVRAPGLGLGERPIDHIKIRPEALEEKPIFWDPEDEPWMD